MSAAQPPYRQMVWIGLDSRLVQAIERYAIKRWGILRRNRARAMVALIRAGLVAEGMELPQE